MVKFAHMADLHLGYRQYGSEERAIDFAQAFLKAMKEAVKERVDFIIIAGDMFHRKSDMDPLTLTQAIKVLEIAKERDVPVIAVEGNHDSAYFRDTFSWLDYLAHQNLLINLKPNFEEDMVVEEWDGSSGAYVDLECGVRVYGMKYYGSMTEKVLEMYSKKIKKKGFTIFVAHAGVEGYVNIQGCVPSSRFHKLNVDYIALGHIHMSFIEGKIHNPGSLEVCDISELKYDRGFFIVEVNGEVKAKLKRVGGREFEIINAEIKNEEDIKNLKSRLSNIKVERPVIYLNIKCSRSMRKVLDEEEIKRSIKVNPIALKIRWEIFDEFSPVVKFEKEDIELSVISQILENYSYGNISEEVVTLKNAFCGKFSLEKIDEFVDEIFVNSKKVKKITKTSKENKDIEKEIAKKKEVIGKCKAETEKIEKAELKMKDEDEEEVWDWRRTYDHRSKTRKH